MAEEYRWCRDLPVVNYKDEDGNEYCIFHAPLGKKGISVEEFNEEVFKRINEVKRLNSIPKASPSGPISKNEREIRPCNLSGTVFEGNIDFIRFDAFNPLPPIDFSRSEFNGEVNFSRVTFTREADFRNAEFREKANFFKTTFREGLFSGAIFSKEVDFSGTKFGGMANFFLANFRGVAYFFKASFGEKADFSGATFTWVNFSENTFNGDANFVKISIEAGDFCGLNIREKVRFEKVNLEKVSFLDTDLRRIDFINCTWPKKDGRNVLYDEIELFKKGKGKDFGDKIKKVEILYRQLKQKYKEEHNEPDVSNWHYGEKEMQRKRTIIKEFFSFLFLNLYYFSSGYGEEPRKALFVLLFLFLLFSLALGIFGLSPVDANNSSYGITNVRWPYDMDFSKLEALFINILKYITFQRDYYLKPSTQFGEFLKFIAQILIPLQTALFALAIRNRFRR